MKTINEKKSPENEDEIIQLKGENSQLKGENCQLKGENCQLKGENSVLIKENSRMKGYLIALKGDSHKLDFFDFSDYIVKSTIGEGGTSSVKLVVKNEEYAMKELKDSNHKSVKRFLTEGEVMFILRHPCILKQKTVLHSKKSLKY